LAEAAVPAGKSSRRRATKAAPKFLAATAAGERVGALALGFFVFVFSFFASRKETTRKKRWPLSFGT
jgi:hypothetical protein